METSIWNLKLFRFHPKIIQFLRNEGFVTKNQTVSILMLGGIEYHTIIFELEIWKIRISVSNSGVIFLFCDGSLQGFQWGTVSNFEHFMETYGEILNLIENGENE
ncbi:MAG: hypothetical protein WBP41_14685 [Saprospiraceae bacterium]